MSFKKVDLSLPTDFKNIVRLFPLPNLVVFPGVIQGLHVFEPRYRQLVHDSIASDQLITMAVLKPNWELASSSNPAIHQIVTIGKVLTHSELDDGRFNLLLLGAKRARIVNEIATQKPYRLAEVKVQGDFCDATSEKEGLLREALLSEFRSKASLEKQIDEEAVEKLLHDDMPLGLLCDLICYSLGVPIAEQTKVLATLETSSRAEMVLELIRKKLPFMPTTGMSANFPPDFSIN